jgi:hypothetical protein
MAFPGGPEMAARVVVRQCARRRRWLRRRFAATASAACSRSAVSLGRYKHDVALALSFSMDGRGKQTPRGVPGLRLTDPAWWLLRPGRCNEPSAVITHSTYSRKVTHETDYDRAHRLGSTWLPPTTTCLQMRASRVPVDCTPGEVLTEKSAKRRTGTMSDIQLQAEAARSFLTAGHRGTRVDYSGLFVFGSLHGLELPSPTASPRGRTGLQPPERIRAISR